MQRCHPMFCSRRGQWTATEIDGEEMAKAEASAIVEEEEYRLRALDFSSLHLAGQVRQNDDIGGGGKRESSWGRGYQEKEEGWRRRRARRAGLLWGGIAHKRHAPISDNGGA